MLLDGRGELRTIVPRANYVGVDIELNDVHGIYVSRCSLQPPCNSMNAEPSRKANM